MDGTIVVRSMPGAGTAAIVEVPAFVETMEAAERAGTMRPIGARAEVGAPVGAESTIGDGESGGRRAR
jgi:hypothetical protein